MKMVSQIQNVGFVEVVKKSRYTNLIAVYGNVTIDIQFAGDKCLLHTYEIWTLRICRIRLPPNSTVFQQQDRFLCQDPYIRALDIHVLL